MSKTEDERQEFLRDALNGSDNPHPDAATWATSAYSVVAILLKGGTDKFGEDELEELLAELLKRAPADIRVRGMMHALYGLEHANQQQEVSS